MSLQEYRRKRRFDRTAEPSPDQRLSAGARAIFVVQLHHASRRHYDFRLQVGGALKSWAVPKGPSLDPKVKRLAVEVEDHPVGYADFEGDIPEGEYGAGHVDLFDRGIWSTDGDAETQLAKGHLRFELHGRRLNGQWHLVRSGRKARQPEWFLIKAQDRHAAAIEADDMLATPLPAKSRAARTPAKRAAAKRATRAPRAGAMAKRAAALPGARKSALVPGFFELQLCRLREHVPPGDDYVHEAKWDGYRMAAVIVRGDVRIWSRNGIEWTQRLPDIVDALRALRIADARIDGELIAAQGRQSDFNVLQSTLSGDTAAPLVYVMFDLLHLDGYDLGRCTLLARKALLETILVTGASSHLSYSSHVVGNGDAAFAAASAHGLEGIISKRALAPYRAGRSDDWIKVKSLASDEFAVVGFTAPKGSRTGFGSLLLARPDGRGGWSYAGRVGSGFNDAQLRALSPALRRGARSTPTVTVGTIDPELRGASWIEPVTVAEVYYRGIGNKGLLRQPSLKTLRDDKRAADLLDPDRTVGERAKPRATAAAARVAKRSKKAGGDAGELTITSPQRIVYPDRRATKGDVVEYYRAVMDWLLPEIENRPLSIVRCPDGIAKACFFQKHLTAGLKRVGSVRLKEESGNNANYLYVADADAVLELVQFNALEFHPWGSTVADPDRANRIVFDLDPGEGVEWAQVTRAARRIRTLLQDLGLESFVRLSGGKGLHVVVPLNPGCSWSIVKPFARGFAETLAAAHPADYVATATKSVRGGRIFVDYLRNGRGATSVASYSLRSRPGAPVAFPVAWSELGKYDNAAAFDIETAQRRLARMRKHPWEGIDGIRQDLDRVSRQLEQSQRRKT